MAEHISHQSLQVTRTAHYSTYGTLDKNKTKYLWIVMHGYGQLAKRMIHKFNQLNVDEHFVVVAEGLNRFYWHGENRSPVSCWMTSEDRYDEIDDFTSYLDQLYSKYASHINQKKVKIMLMGFSQGCATMWRWIHASQPRYDMALNWAGWIPEDISYVHLKEYLSDKKHFFWYGNEDEFLTDGAMAGIKSVIKQNELSIEIHQFDGGHKLVRGEFLKFVNDHVEEGE